MNRPTNIKFHNFFKVDETFNLNTILRRGKILIWWRLHWLMIMSEEKRNRLVSFIEKDINNKSRFLVQCDVVLKPICERSSGKSMESINNSK